MLLHRDAPSLPARFSPDGRLLAVARGAAVDLLDARTGAPAGRVAGHDGDVTALAFSPDGRALVTGGADATVIVGDLARTAR